MKCSVGVDAAKDKCPGKLEIMVVIDRSGSVQDNPQDFQDEKDFAKALMSPFKMDPAFTRAGVAFFDSDASLSLSLTSDVTAVAAAIDLSTGTGGTFMGAGLAIAQTELKNARAGVPQLVVLVTDGQDTSNEDQTRARATQMKNDGIHIMTVGFTTGVDEDALKALASKRGNTTLPDYHYAPSADKLGSILEELATETCIIVTPPKPVIIPKVLYAKPLQACVTGTTRDGEPPSPVTMTMGGRDLQKAVTDYGANAFKVSESPRLPLYFVALSLPTHS